MPWYIVVICFVCPVTAFSALLYQMKGLIDS